MPPLVPLRAQSSGLSAAKCRAAGRRLHIESLEDRTLLAADPLPNEWAAGDGGTKNLYTGLTWLDARGPSGTWMSWSYAQNYAADSTLNGQDDWRMPSLQEGQQAAVNGAGEAGFVFGAPSSWYHHWTSTTAAGQKAWAVFLSDPAGTAAPEPKGSAFALTMVRDPATTIDDGTAGYDDTGWSSKKSSAANAGDYRQRAAGDGSHTATWTFTGLEAGASYKVAATWIAGSGYASNAPYTILDGTGVEQSVAINQKVAPNDFAAGSVSWEGLGTFTVDSGTISVQLSNLADGTVIADAVRVFKVASAPAPLAAMAFPTTGDVPVVEDDSTTDLAAYLTVTDADSPPPPEVSSEGESESDLLTSAGGLDPAAVDEAPSEVPALSLATVALASVELNQSVAALDPLPNQWAAGDGGTKNLYTGLVWLDTRGLSGSWMDLSYATNYAANSTANGYDDWRVPSLPEAQQAAQNEMGAQGIVYGGVNSPYPHWTSTTAGPRHAWAVWLADPAGSAEAYPKGSALVLNMVRDTGTTTDDGTAGYADSGWQSKKNSAANAGDYRYKAAGDGSHTATWTFSGLEVGASYKVATTWLAGSGYASNAPYTVLDGAAVEQSVAINQTTAPNDFAASSVSWESLGTFTVDSGTLSVQLSNLADGTVIADAVRVFKVASAPAPLSAPALQAADAESGVSEEDHDGSATGLLAYLIASDSDLSPPPELSSEEHDESPALTSAGGLDAAAVDLALSDEAEEEIVFELLLQ